MHIRRLKLLFKIFRVFNLFWILFCLLMVEMTLNKNHMRRTIAQDGGIRFPSQLLPLLIGGLSFIRVLWLIYAEGRDRVDDERRLATALQHGLSREGYVVDLAHDGGTDKPPTVAASPRPADTPGTYEP